MITVVSQPHIQQFLLLVHGEYDYLKEIQSKKGDFTLTELSTSDGTDEELHVFFDVEMGKYKLSFLYSIGYDSDVDAYLPYAEVTGSKPGEPEAYTYKHFFLDGTSTLRLEELEGAFEPRTSTIGEVRYLGFKWLTIEGATPN